jgi:uncharacterized protein (TIGR03437 family)
MIAAAASLYAQADPAVTTFNLPGGTVGVAYSATLTGSGGLRPYTWSILQGVLPPGLTLAADTGVISGIPATAGTFSFTVALTDNAGRTATRGLSIAIAAVSPNPVISTTELPQASLGVPYSTTLAASGGRTPYRWSVNPDPPAPGIVLDPATGALRGTPSREGAFTFTATVTDAGNLTATRGFTLNVAGRQTFTASPAQLDLTVAAGIAAPSPHLITVFSTGADTGFRAALDPPSAWASLRSATGQTPGAVALNLESRNLAPGAYRTAVVVTSNDGTLTARIPVTLNVRDPGPPRLEFVSPDINFPVARGTVNFQIPLLFTNAGGSAVNYSGSWQNLNGGNWGGIFNTTGSLTTGQIGIIGLNLRPSTLDAGAYEGLLTVNSGVPQLREVPAALLVSQAARAFRLSQAAFDFTGAAGGANPPAQEVRLLNVGTEALEWTVASSAAWLRPAPAAGSLAAGAVAPVGLAVDLTGLAPGGYNATLRFSAPGAAGSPQTVTVFLTVRPRGETLAPALNSTGVVLNATPSQTVPASTTVTIYNPNPGPLRFASAVATEDGANWLSVSPAEGNLPPGNTALRVSADSRGLGGGTRRGVIRLRTADGTITTLSAAFLIADPVAGGQGSKGTAAAANVRPCDPARGLLLQLARPAAGFQSQRLRPLDLEVQVRDCRGEPIDAATVTVGCSGNLCRQNLNRVARGVWAGTITPPATADPLTMSITAVAIGANNTFRAEQIDISGAIAPAPGDEPGLPVAVVNAASGQRAGRVAPGNWASIYGVDLAAGTEIASSVPFPLEVAGTRVELGGQPLPLLFTAPGQINALIPRNLSPDTAHTLVVSRAGRASIPLNVTVQSVLPAIFATNQQGTGQGAILIANTDAVAGPPGSLPGARPAERGGFVQIYAGGLGPVTNAPADGAPAPAAPPFATTVDLPEVTIGGVPAAVTFSGLAPGLVGLYQLNVQIPAQAPVGDAVPVVVRVRGLTSNTVTMAVR